MKFAIGERVVVEESNIEHIEKYAGRTGVVIDYLHTSGEHDYLVRFDNDPLLEIWCKVKRLNEDKHKIVITTDGKTTVATQYKDGRPLENGVATCSPDDNFDFMTGAKLALERLDKKINPIMVNGFKVGDRINYRGMNGTVIGIDGDDDLCVQFDHENKFELYSHRCDSSSLKDGKPGTTIGYYYLFCSAERMKHGEVPTYYNGKVVCVDTKGCDDYWTKGKIYQFVDGRTTSDGGCTTSQYTSFDSWCKGSAASWLEIKE